MEVFTTIGMAVTGILVIFLIAIIYICILSYIDKLISRYHIKHRYKKSPTAKCYCRDCEQWESETGKCWDQCNSRLMAPNWFCCFAEPLIGEKFEDREQEIKQMEKELREKRKKRGFKNGTN